MELNSSNNDSKNEGETKIANSGDCPITNKKYILKKGIVYDDFGFNNSPSFQLLERSQSVFRCKSPGTN